jgi:hypothetical protein
MRSGGGVARDGAAFCIVFHSFALRAQYDLSVWPNGLLRILDELLSYKLSAYFFVNKEYLRC